MKPVLPPGTILVAVKRESPDPAARRAAAALAAAAGARLVEFDPTARGIPAVEIVRTAERLAATLIVVPREPREIVEGAVRRSRVPCLVVPPSQTTFSRILAAVDQDSDSIEILDAALALGRLAGATVTALHVDGPALVAAGHAGERPAWRVAPTAAYDVLLRQGDPVAEILQAVRDRRIDLLVHGHHRGGPRNGHETGSIAARLLERAPCAVLTVPI